MARTPWFQRLERIRALAQLCERGGFSEPDAIGHLAAPGRRRAVRAAGAAAVVAAVPLAAQRALAQATPDVAVVGAGFAGLYAATVLAGKRVATEVYEAGTAVGGRVASLRGVFPGQVAERGAELIDTTHSTVRGLATAYGLTLENYEKQPGEESFYFFGRHYSEAEVVAEYRALVAAMTDDLKRLSGAPTADAYNAHDRLLDLMPLSRYLDTRGAGALLRKVIDVAYTIEFGREISSQSSLSFLLFAQANKRGRFTPFGNFSDERFHIVEGNDAISKGLADRLPRPVQLGHQLMRVAATSDGRLRLSFLVGGRTVERVHSALILSVPAPIAREIVFDASVALPPASRAAIAGMDYGTNSKMMIGFRGRPWYERIGSNGGSYSDLANHQNTWETNFSQARFGERGVLTDYSGGMRGARLDPRRLQREAGDFLGDLERVWPGTTGLAMRDARGNVLAHLENWSLNPLFKGAYSNNQPGYFTGIEGHYAKPALPNLVFAGEHTDSFYSYQGFMEGALLSGARAADQIWRARR